jgi:hypothetical protein
LVCHGSFNLKIKTKLIYRKKPVIPQIVLDNETFEKVRDFDYLGFSIAYEAAGVAHTV